MRAYAESADTGVRSRYLLGMLQLVLVLFLSFLSRRCFSSLRYRPLQLKFQDAGGSVRFETRALSFEGIDSARDVRLDLFPILHIGSSHYFQELEKKVSRYDVVLFELITSSDNTVLENGLSHRRMLRKEVRSPKAEAIAEQFGFSTQLDMNLYRPGWYVADLDAETVYKLETERKDIILQKYIRSKIKGRGNSPKNTLFPESLDSPFIAILRAILWTTPCPELGLLTIDWSRVQPSAGGVPRVVFLILENLLMLRLLEAKKIAFAQQILSGIADDGGTSLYFSFSFYSLPLCIQL